MAVENIRTLLPGLIIILIFNCIACHGDQQYRQKGTSSSGKAGPSPESGEAAAYELSGTIIVLPKNPQPAERFRILATGGEKIRKAQIIIEGPSGRMESLKSKFGAELPYWRIDDFAGNASGKYKATLITDKKVVATQEFEISERKEITHAGVVWKNLRGWDSGLEAIYSAWINALFQGCDEQDSWPSLHEVTRSQERNFLYNYLSLGEDDRNGQNNVIMQPDCADNPFFLRAYFAWKLGLPFGYHECNRGSLVKSPGTGNWITNEIPSSKTNPVLAFNAFVRRVADGVHSGTARTALDNEMSDYYPVALDRRALQPGTVFADPYGHTLTLVSWVPQTNDHPGLLLAVDAQPDGTVGIKQFWKGNFLFNTTGVVGEPGFKAFRPVSINKGVPLLLKNKALTASAGFVPFSLEQRKMKSDLFYRSMERLINPKPLDPETALLEQIRALHEQLMVRITSVANGEAYFKSHPGTVISMPSSAAGIFQAGGQWENFSTPNRDLRLLIAIDAVLDFPDRIVRSPDDFNISAHGSPAEVKRKLQSVLEKSVTELTITYTRTDGSLQKLTVGDILNRRDAFEMAYNPNDGIEIRWGAPENSDERSTCRRHKPPTQSETMRSVRVWFHKRLHPPT